MDLEVLKKNCEKNRFEFEILENKEECLKRVNELIQANDVVSHGGSVTLEQVGILDLLKERKDISYLDRRNCEDVQKLYREVFSSDIYLTSSNALTMDGELYNVDGTGNRVAAMMFGPKKVLVVVGLNKIVDNMQKAIEHVEKVAAVQNNIRLNKENPCVKIGHCVHCQSPTKICRLFTVIRSSAIEKRIHILCVKENLGY